MSLFGSPSFLSQIKKKSHKNNRRQVYHMQKGNLCKELEKLVGESQKLAASLLLLEEKALLTRFEKHLQRIELLFALNAEADWQKEAGKMENVVRIFCRHSTQELASLRKDVTCHLWIAKFKKFLS